MLMAAGGLQGQLRNKVVTCGHILSQALLGALTYIPTVDLFWLICLILSLLATDQSPLSFNPPSPQHLCVHPQLLSTVLFLQTRALNSLM